MAFVKSKSASIATQLTLPIAVVGFFVLLFLGVYQGVEAYRTTKQYALDNLKKMAESSSLEIKNYLDRPFAQVESLGHELQLRIQGRSANRSQSIEVLQDMLVSHKDYLATWAGFEPNAFDGQDDKFKNAPQHEKSGRFYPWWIRQGDNIVYKTIINEETPEFGDWYFVPQKTKKTHLTEPYGDTVDGKYIFMTSTVYPVVTAGEFRGVVGIDISLETVTRMIEKIRPYPETKVYLLTDTNKIVAGPNKDMLMKNFEMDAALKTAIEKQTATSLEISRAEEETLVISVPVTIYDLDQKWTLVLETPMSTIMAPVKKKLAEVLVVSLVALILLMATVYVSAQRLSKKMTVITSNLHGSAATIVESLESLNSSGSQLSNSSTEAAASIQQTASSLEEITSMVKMNSENARLAASLSSESEQLAAQGEHEVKKLVAVMTDIEKSSKKIEEIISIIDDIAFQTNLLALNASVESARAGEHGRGFAVVADAVRTLAQRSSVAAKDIGSLILTSVDQIKEATRVAQENGDVLEKISKSVNKVAGLNKEIAHASEEQSNGIVLINTAITSIDSMIQTNATQAKDIVQIAGKIGDTSQVMHTSVQALNGEVA